MGFLCLVFSCIKDRTFDSVLTDHTFMTSTWKVGWRSLEICHVLVDPIVYFWITKLVIFCGRHKYITLLTRNYHCVKSV